MSWLREVWARLASYLHRRKLDDEFTEELAVHVDVATDEHIRRGLLPFEARRRALIELGGVEPTKEVHRERRGLPWLDAILQDIRYAVRCLRRSPAFALSSILVLSLAIGANTAMFSVIEAVVLRPLPYRDADRLVMLWKSVPSQDIEWDWVSYPAIRDWREQNKVFEDIAFVLRPEASEVTLEEPDGLRRLQASKVSLNFFAVLGVAPILGSPFPAAEQNPVVLSHGFWQQHFGGDREVLGRPLRLDGSIVTVVGVMPPDFAFPDEQTQLWMPITSDARWSDFQTVRFADAFSALARLKPDVGIEQARVDMDAISTALGEEHPRTDAGFAVRVVSVFEQITPTSVQQALWMLGGAAFCALLIACSNIAGLLTARAFARRKELLMRVALGAGRLRLLQSLAAESILLCMAGGAGGLAFANALLSGLLAYIPPEMTRTDHIAINWAALVFTFALSGLVGLVFGMLPALRVTSELQICEGVKVATTASVGQWLVAAQFALATVLLTGAGLLTRSYLLLSAVEPGFETVGLLTARVEAPQDVWADRGRSRRFLDEALRRIEAIPGVRGAAVGSAVIDSLLGNVPNESIKTESSVSVDRPDRHARISVSDDYFRVLGIPVLRGRSFSSQDSLDGPKVAVINQELADRFWPGQDPLGKRFQEVYPGIDSPWLTVVGIASDAIHNKDGRPAPVFYLSTRQRLPRNAVFVVGAEGASFPLAEPIRRAIQGTVPGIPDFDVVRVDGLLAEQVRPRVFQASLLTGFAAASLLLTGFGLFAVVMQGVQRRTREIGVRTALGATASDIVRLVVLEGLRWAGAGAAVGAVGAFLYGRALSRFLFGISPTDPLTLAVTVGLLSGIGGLAAALPAYRASRITPTLALRHD